MLAVNGKLGNLTLLFLVFASLFGIVLAFFFVVNPPFMIQDDYALRKHLAGGTLAVICLLGIFAALYPNPCAKITGLRKHTESVHSSVRSSSQVFRGHHVVCSPYSTHIIRVGNSVFCATCSGLVVGAIAALVCVGLFFFGNLRINIPPLLLVSVGAMSVTATLLYPTVPSRFQNGFARFSTGILLPVGSFLVLAGVNEAVKSLSASFFFVMVSVLWLATKMSLSQWEHRRTCTQCTLNTCKIKQVV